MTAKRRKHRSVHRRALLALCLLLVLGAGIGGTVAYLTDNTAPVVNVFAPAEVQGEVDEDFDGEKKTSITVKNTGTIPCYIRVMLAPYYVDANGNPVGSFADGSPAVWSPGFTLGSGWTQIGNYYYYTTPVAVGASTGNLLGSAITLQTVNGYRQALDVFAECIQAEPAGVMQNTWKVSL